MAKRTDPCAGCVYQVKAGGYLVCDYISITGSRRPCPFGAGCTVKETEKNMKNWDKAKAFELYQAGASDKEIAAEVEVSPGTIYKWRHEKGLAAHMPARQAPQTAGGGVGGVPKFPPRSEPPEPEAVEGPDGSGPKGTEPEKSGPMELHLELAGGWARIRAPGWVQAAKLWRMMDVCIAALRTEGGADE